MARVIFAAFRQKIVAHSDKYCASLLRLFFRVPLKYGCFFNALTLLGLFSKFVVAANRPLSAALIKHRRQYVIVANRKLQFWLPDRRARRNQQRRAAQLDFWKDDTDTTPKTKARMCYLNRAEPSDWSLLYTPCAVACISDMAASRASNWRHHQSASPMTWLFVEFNAPTQHRWWGAP